MDDYRIKGELENSRRYTEMSEGIMAFIRRRASLDHHRRAAGANSKESHDASYSERLRTLFLGFSIRIKSVGKVSRGSMGPVAKPVRNDRCLRI
jgi:hypothetical protein